MTLKVPQQITDKPNMDRETFLEQVKQQYMERITAIYVQAEHTGSVDFGQLTTALQKLKKSAAAEGIKAADFDEMVYSAIPEMEGKFDLPPVKKAA